MIKYKINKGFIVQKMGKKTTIFDSEESALYTFNETASYIFQKLKLGWEKKKIIEGLVKKYQGKKERVEKDFDGIFVELMKKKIFVAGDKKPRRLNRRLGD